jgi:hypothetical protein
LIFFFGVDDSRRRLGVRDVAGLRGRGQFSLLTF